MVGTIDQRDLHAQHGVAGQHTALGGLSAAVLDAGYGTLNKLEINTKSDLNGLTNLKTTFLRTAADSISAVFRASTSYKGVDFTGTVDGGGTVTVATV